MKFCPNCGKTYSDPNLNFCLEDGTVLNRAQTNQESSLPDTVMINQSQPSSYNQQFGGQPQNQNSATSNRSNSSAKKASNAWIWVVGILGLVVVLCGGGFGGLFLLGSLSQDNTKWNSNFGKNSDYNVSKPNTTSGSSSDNPIEAAKIDLEKWVQKNSAYGNTEYRGNEFFMSAKKDNFYYVLVARSQNSSNDATTKVTLRDVESGNNSLGYGLIVNSNPVPLIKDYAFLINTKTGKYRVVSHSPGKEKTIVNWKSSSSIKSGSQENVLEVQEQNKQFKFFINGDLIETVSSSDSYQNGVAGLYVGGKSPIAFSNLEIRK